MANTVFNKQLLKKWWFWVIVVVVLSIIGLATGDSDTNTTTKSSDSDNSNSSKIVGTLPVINKSDYNNKEALVAFKDLISKSYSVTAKYVNEAVPAANQEFTEQFTNADANSCQDRLSFDAYLVSDVTQNGDSVALTLTNQPTSNQTCPAGTTNDL